MPWHWLIIILSEPLDYLNLNSAWDLRAQTKYGCWQLSYHSLIHCACAMFSRHKAASHSQSIQRAPAGQCSAGVRWSFVLTSDISSDVRMRLDQFEKESLLRVIGESVIYFSPPCSCLLCKVWIKWNGCSFHSTNNRISISTELLIGSRLYGLN